VDTTKRLYPARLGVLTAAIVIITSISVHADSSFARRVESNDGVNLITFSSSGPPGGIPRSFKSCGYRMVTDSGGVNVSVNIPAPPNTVQAAYANIKNVNILGYIGSAHFYFGGDDFYDGHDTALGLAPHRAISFPGPSYILSPQSRAYSVHLHVDSTSDAVALAITFWAPTC
jgi:hypothetical protein